MWKCSKCGEQIGANFEICWACGTSKDGAEDPHFFEDDDKDPSLEPYTEMAETGAPQERLLTVTTCILAAEAHALRIKLQENDIRVFLADEFTVTMDWLLANAIGGIKVQVAESDWTRACEILAIAQEKEEQRDDEKEEQEDEDDVKDEW
jgi:hypothetical protein